MTRAIEVTFNGHSYRVVYTDNADGVAFTGMAEESQLDWAMQCAEARYYAAKRAWQEMTFGADKTGL